MLFITVAMKTIDYTRLEKVHHILPKVLMYESEWTICNHCRHINESEWMYCTYCGYPMHKMDNAISLFHSRIREKHQMLLKSEKEISNGRIATYIMAAVFSTGLGVMFTEMPLRVVYAASAIVLSILFIILARWSKKNAFSALLTACIILITFSAIHIVNKITNQIFNYQGFYGISFYLLLLFFIIRGVQGAYKADLLREELQAN